MPLEKGWVKVRGFSEGVTKGELVEFLKGGDPNLSELDVSVVRGADGDAPGRGSSCGSRVTRPVYDWLWRAIKASLATRINGKKATERVEVFSAHAGDLERRLMSGCVLA